MGTKTPKGSQRHQLYPICASPSDPKSLCTKITLDPRAGNPNWHGLDQKKEKEKKPQGKFYNKAETDVKKKELMIKHSPESSPANTDTHYTTTNFGGESPKSPHLTNAAILLFKILHFGSLLSMWTWGDSIGWCHGRRSGHFSIVDFHGLLKRVTVLQETNNCV